MQRRNLLIGMGSLAVGSAAAMGTGAFTTATAERTVDVNVASDEGGFVEIQALNGTYASETDDGQLELDFNSDSGLGIFDGDAQGLNADATFNFDEVFRIANAAGQGDMRVVIEATGFDLESLELTADGSDSVNLSSGKSLRAADYSDVDNIPKLVQPDSVDVNITIETKGDGTMGDVGGTLHIHAATGGNRNDLSNVI
jgi:opacity protein-like surface antigen